MTNITPRYFSRTMLPILCCLLSSPTGANTAASAAGRAMLPDRLLHCTIGRMTNLDPSKNQTNADIVYDGHHAFDLFLPGIAVRTAPPPDPVYPPEPVDPRTRIAADPDGLAADVPAKFTRVVDYWPERVELSTTIAGSLANLIIVHPIDAAHHHAHLFMTRARDMSSYDLAHVYAGDCEVSEPARGG